MITDEEFQKIMNKIDEHFSKPENVEKFKEYMKKEIQKPCYTHLQCDTGWCKHNRPKGFVEMGTITWCNKYKCDEKGCKNRTWTEVHYGI